MKRCQNWRVPTMSKYLYCVCGPVIVVCSTRHEAVGKAAAFTREHDRELEIMPLAVPEAVWEAMDTQ